MRGLMPSPLPLSRERERGTGRTTELQWVCGHAPRLVVAAPRGQTGMSDLPSDHAKGVIVETTGISTYGNSRSGEHTRTRSRRAWTTGAHEPRTLRCSAEVETTE